MHTKGLPSSLFKLFPSIDAVPILIGMIGTDDWNDWNPIHIPTNDAASNIDAAGKRHLVV